MAFTTLVDVESLRGDEVLLDCRFDLADAGTGRKLYLAAHLPGARFADLNRDLSSPVTTTSGRHPLPTPAALAAFFAAAGIGDAAQVVAYDESSGAFAARAWWLLRWLGHPAAAVLDGGFKAWVTSGRPVEAGDIPRQPAAAFTIRPRLLEVVSSADVLRAIGEPYAMLMDARAPERFAGTVEPLDAVPGHVPGAVNHPFAGNLTPDGRFLSVPELAHRWRERLAGVEPARVVMMCGSGVTACHNLLALEAAGLPGARLYAGSWSEWIRDPSRPIAGPARK